jgi:bacterioferritin-associated ferredoxin
VTDRVIDSEIARGARTIEELVDRCGAGAECGGCWPTLEELLHGDHHHQHARELANAPR